MARHEEGLDFKLPWTVGVDPEDGSWAMLDRDGEVRARLDEYDDALFLRRMTGGATTRVKAGVTALDVEPGMSEALEKNRAEGFTAEAIAARAEAAEAGKILGQWAVALIHKGLDRVPAVDTADPYLQYLMWSAVAQEITNEGRKIGGLDWKKGDNELEGRKR